MNETKKIALELAIEARSANTDIVGLATDFYAFLTSETGNEEATKPKRGRASKPDTTSADGAASEQSAPNTSKLEPVDEQPTEPKQEVVDEKPAVAEGPSRDDVLTAATKFSQAHGADALMAALKDVGAAKFSEVPVEKYQQFLDVMAKAGASASALS